MRLDSHGRLALAGAFVLLLQGETIGLTIAPEPQRLFAALGLRAGLRVADVGAGDGEWAERLAREVGETGHVFATEVDPAGEPVEHAYTLHGNAVTAQALEVLRRTLDEEAARDVEDPDAVRAALRRHFVVERDVKERFASSSTLSGDRSTTDSPVASALWLPLYDAVTRDDSLYRRTARDIPPTPDSLLQRCARLVGPFPRSRIGPPPETP